MTGPTGSGLFGPISDAERRQWQIRAHAVLATVLHNANRAALVPLVWRLGTGQLLGEVATLGLTGPQVRDIYTAWVDFLDLANRREHTSSDGVHLTAFGDVPESEYRRGTYRAAAGIGRPVGITAHIRPDDETDPTTEEC